MEGQPPGKLPSSRGPSLKNFVIRGRTSAQPDGKALGQKERQNARATLDSGLQSPRRPTIDPESDERRTRQRRDEDELLRAIEGAMTRNDDASAEQLLLQLNKVQQQGVVLREHLESSGRANQLLACRERLNGELETTSTLKLELRAATKYVRALETRIEASAARVENLAKEFDALLARPET